MTSALRFNVPAHEAVAHAGAGAITPEALDLDELARGALALDAAEEQGGAKHAENNSVEGTHAEMEGVTVEPASWQVQAHI